MFSGSKPATIFSGRAGTFCPSETPTQLMIFVRYATLLSLSLMLPLFSSSSEYKPSANPVLRVTSEITSCRNRNGGFFSKFSVSCVCIFVFFFWPVQSVMALFLFTVHATKEVKEQQVGGREEVKCVLWVRGG